MVQQPRLSQQQQQWALNFRKREELLKNLPMSDASEYQLPLQNDYGFALPGHQHSEDAGQHQQATHSRHPPVVEHHDIQPAGREEYLHKDIQHGSPGRPSWQLAQQLAWQHADCAPVPGPGMIRHGGAQQHPQYMQSIRGLATGNQMPSRLRPPAVQGQPERLASQDVSMAPAGTYRGPMHSNAGDTAPARLDALVQRDSRRSGGIVGQVVREAQQSSYKPSPVFRAEEFRPSVVQVM